MEIVTISEKVQELLRKAAENLRLGGIFLKNRSIRVTGRYTHPNRAEDELLIVRMKELHSRELGSVTTERELPEMEKLQSELFGDEQSVAEMTAPESIR